MFNVYCDFQDFFNIFNKFFHFFFSALQFVKYYKYKNGFNINFFAFILHIVSHILNMYWKKINSSNVRVVKQQIGTRGLFILRTKTFFVFLLLIDFYYTNWFFLLRLMYSKMYKLSWNIVLFYFFFIFRFKSGKKEIREYLRLYLIYIILKAIL